MTSLCPATPPALRIEQNVPLAPMTTIGLGGPARYFVRARDVDEVRAALDWAAGQRQPVFVLGGGSNLLIADEGFDGLVLKLDNRGIVVESEDTHVMVKAAAGERWDDFVAFTVNRGWSGVECLSGIPGSVGATPIQNVGAYGQEVCQTIARVELLDRTSGRVVWMTNEECEFGYRTSRFKTREPDRYIVLSVTYRLLRDGVAELRYPELARYMEEHAIDRRDLAKVREAVIAIRRRKGMVIDPDDPDTRSDGSFFVNPVLSAEQYAAFEQRARAVVGADGVIPTYPAGDGDIKLSAAWLIERAGFQKGYTHKRVGLSSKHTLALINRGGTTQEMLELVGIIQAGVRRVFGVELHPEPNFVGLPGA